MKKFIIFIAFCFGISFSMAAAFHFAGLEYGSLWGQLLGSIYMLVPVLSVILTQLLTKEKPLSGVGLSFKLNKWWIVGWLAMPVFNVLAMFASTLLPEVSFSIDNELIRTSLETAAKAGTPMGPWGFFWITILSSLLAGATINAFFALGEEIAWRGYLPRIFKDWSFLKKCLVIGVVWGLWHAPLILMGHNYPSHPVIGVFMMVLFCVLFTPVLLFLREKGKSVILPAIAHGTLNASAGLSIAYLTSYNDLLGGSCGLVGMAILLLTDIAIFLYLSKKEACSK